MPDFKEVAYFDTCLATAETGDDLLVRFFPFEGRSWDRQLWLPKNQISSDSGIQSLGDSGTLIISQWIAEQIGLV